MFKSSTGYFSSVKCPKLDHCKLPNCIFKHESKRSISTVTPEQNEVTRTVKKPNLSKPQPKHETPIKLSQSLEYPEEDLKLWTPKPLEGVGAPATLGQRVKYITALIVAYQKNGFSVPKFRAVSDEHSIALLSTKATYPSQVKSWIAKVAMNQNHYEMPKAVKKTLTSSESFEAVKKLVHSVDKLKRNQYVTKIPTDYLFEVKDRNMKTCDHCSENFYLSQIGDKTKCQYHDRKKQVSTGGGERTATWLCCSEIVGESQGCKELKHHVFKSSDPFEMHQFVPFRETPEADSSKKQQIIGLDCEMGYTTKGMEVIRLTIVDFFTGSTVFDEIIKPSGKIIDLNTQWSGVSDIPHNAMTLEAIHDVVLGTLIDKDTIIIGHGLENDLNVLRLVHHNVVDTAILFPRTLTKKYALKDLAAQFLDRLIQTGEHSSEEDSLAAIDIIKLHISKA